MDDRRNDAEKNQTATETGKAGLSPRQEMAVRELSRGQTMAVVARRVGINRATLYRWMEDPNFAAAMNRWRRAAIEAARAQLIAALGDAAKTVVNAVRRGDVPASMHLLNRMGLMEPTAEADADAETATRRRELERRADRVTLDRIGNTLDEAEEMNAAMRQLHVPAGPSAGAADAPPPVRNVSAEEKEKEKEKDTANAAGSAKEPNSPSAQTPGMSEVDQPMASKGEPQAVNRAEPPVAGNIEPPVVSGAGTVGKKPDAEPPAVPSPAAPPAPAAPTRRRISRPTGHVGMRGPYGEPYAPGSPEPIDELEDQFTDIFREDR